ncbi:hypothetical protein ACFC0M_06015 [Streptomyces sp. NPDC056149]|uniref:hypothetical protein n=1 Tax=Streptomyces sp. NPDC056149 TaxID=3345728 RepID=UPI0035DF5D3E
MSARDKPCSQDCQLQEMFGAPMTELYARASGPDASAALTRAVELRSFLALAEEQVAQVRDRVHEAMSADRDIDELSADQLRFDVQWLDAALAARNGYRDALGNLLRTMPPPGRQAQPVRAAQPTVATAVPPSVTAPAPQRAGAARPRQP